MRISLNVCQIFQVQKVANSFATTKDTKTETMALFNVNVFQWFAYNKYHIEIVCRWTFYTLQSKRNLTELKICLYVWDYKGFMNAEKSISGHKCHTRRLTTPGVDNELC